MTINALIKINNTEITEHNRKISLSKQLMNSDIELASGSIKRFYKNPKNSYTINWTYLPDKSTQTIDSRAGRNFLHDLVTTGSTVSLSIQDENKDDWKYYTCFISAYSETLLRNVFQTQCKYYDVSMTLEVL